MPSPNTYVAHFEVPAVLRVSLKVEGADQESALVAAHDAVLTVTPEQLTAWLVSGAASFQRLDVDLATNTELQRTEGDALPVASSPPSPLAIAGRGFRLCHYSSKEPEKATRVHESAGYDYAHAKSLAESTLEELSPYGCSTVVDAQGYEMARVSAPRGGWEVEVLDKHGCLVNRHSWLDSRPAANRMLSQLLAQDACRIRILDFTRRDLGPVLVKDCQ